MLCLALFAFSGIKVQIILPDRTAATPLPPTPPVLPKSAPPRTLPPLAVPTATPKASTSDQSAVKFEFKVTWATVDAVLDGDTIRLTNGDKLRYIGVDTPEKLTHPPECYAQEATRRNRKLVEGKQIALRKDHSEVDRYGRLLRYVYLPDGQMVNEMLVQEGYARAAEFRPDTLFAQRFAQLEQQAKRNNRGMWGKCDL
ncbi:MAG: thermonuclease family protein [Caldilineaceae bacterium]